MAKVLLFSPPYIDTYGGLNIKKIGWGIPPTGIGYIGAYLKSQGIDVRIYDLMFEIDNLNQIRDIIEKENPEIIGIGSTSPQFSAALAIAKIIKKVDNKIKVVFGGPHPTSLPEETISYPEIDIVAVGDGEITMLEICSGIKLDSIKGIYYKNEKNTYFTGDREIEYNLDKFPFPLYEQLAMDRYSSFYFGKSMGIISGRGCPFQCTFCASKIIDKGIYRFRSAENIVEEMNYLYEHYGFKKFSFWDDTFTLRKDRVVELCSKLASNKYKFKWTCNTHINTVDSELLKIMADTGCKIIHIGIESGNNEILKNIKKGIKLDKVRQVIDWAHSYKIIVYGFLMIGLPGDTKDSINQTINFAVKNKVDLAQFSLLTPLPGTEVWTQAENKDGVMFATKELDKFLRYGNAVIELPEVSRTELNALFSKAYRKFYLRPIHLFKLTFKFAGLFNPLHFFKLGISFIRFFKSKIKN
ncbi:radical SAM protein [Candidatus Dependentiae bacterium]|nr:radical SAM protein [Candidatus Dependentiae bacterium]